MKVKYAYRSVLPLLLVTASCLFGCGKVPDPKVESHPSPSPRAETPFERDLDFVRKGSFVHMFVFSRKDGEVFTKDDIAYLKANSPVETNQWVSTDNGRRIIAGTNFEFKQEHFDALYKRFNIEDMSGK